MDKYTVIFSLLRGKFIEIYMMLLSYAYINLHLIALVGLLLDGQ